MGNFKNPHFNLKAKNSHPFDDTPLPKIPSYKGDSKLVITFEQAKKQTSHGLIFSSAHTVWWTSDARDLKKGQIPLDVFGSPLFENTNVDGWFNADAITNHPAYGKPERRIRNFMLAHAKNIHIACDKMPPRSFEKIKNFESFVAFCDENDI